MSDDWKNEADWNKLPKDLYVTGVRSQGGIVFEVTMCSVPMVLAPEVRYVRADAAVKMADDHAELVKRLYEHVFGPFKCDRCGHTRKDESLQLCEEEGQCDWNRDYGLHTNGGIDVCKAKEDMQKAARAIEALVRERDGALEFAEHAVKRAASMREEGREAGIRDVADKMGQMYGRVAENAILALIDKPQEK